MQNWFPTLNAALESEGLLHAWECTNPPIKYNETRSWRFADGTRFGHFVSVYRNESGLYERPVHYSCN